MHYYCVAVPCKLCFVADTSGV